MAGAAAVVHLAQMEVIRLPAWAGLQLGMDVVLFNTTVMGGRVIPMFTNAGVLGAAASKNPFVEKAALGLVLLFGLGDVAGLHGVPLTVLAV